MATPVPFTLNAYAFSKCAPAISTNIKQCGSVTQCNAKSITAEELSTAYMRSNEFRVMEALFHHDIEIKMCEAVQEGMYEFFMANKVNMSSRITTRRLNSGLLEIAPFIMARQYSPINDNYWLVYSGQIGTGGDAGLWIIRVKSTTNIPADVRSFPVDLRVYIDGKTQGGSATRTAWKVVSATLSGDSTYVTLKLSSQNSASSLSADKLGSPSVGVLRRGTPNKSDYEQWCNEMPAYLNWKNVPFWEETTRTSMCRSDLYNKWRKLVLENNALYREFFDLDEIEKNKQLATDWKKRLVNAFFWNKPLPYQNAFEYDNLEEIPSFDGTSLGLGVDGGRCVGKRANAIGIYEQMAQCGRVIDLQDGQLNLPALFIELYNMMRVREGRGHPSPKVFDLFTDTVFAELLNRAFLNYYQAKSNNMLRLTKEVDEIRIPKKAAFGFYYTSYPLFWPQGVVINVVTHNLFDDWITAASVAGIADTARVCWVLDFTGIYPGIITSNRVVARTGDLKTLAEINPSFACVMAVNTQEQTMTSLTWTMIVECPSSNLLLENIAAVVPEHATLSGSYSPGIGTTTTTTTPTYYWNVAQSYTAVNSDCPGGGTIQNGPITVTVPANSYSSTVSIADANAQALAAATAEAVAQIRCM